MISKTLHAARAMAGSDLLKMRGSAKKKPKKNL
jgi:hypothetical protein